MQCWPFVCGIVKMTDYRTEMLALQSTHLKNIPSAQDYALENIFSQDKSALNS